MYVDEIGAVAVGSCHTSGGGGIAVVYLRGLRERDQNVRDVDLPGAFAARPPDCLGRGRHRLRNCFDPADGGRGGGSDPPLQGAVLWGARDREAGAFEGRRAAVRQNLGRELGRVLSLVGEVQVLPVVAFDSSVCRVVEDREC